MMSCLVVKIDVDGLLIDTRESDGVMKGTVIYGWDALWAGTEGLSEGEEDLGQACLKEAKGYYDRAKESRIESDRERGDGRMMRVQRVTKTDRSSAWSRKHARQERPGGGKEKEGK